MLYVIGPCLGFIGTVMVFIFGLPSISVLNGGAYIEIEITPKMKRHTLYSRIGLGLIAVSFLFQIYLVCS